MTDCPPDRLSHGPFRHNKRLEASESPYLRVTAPAPPTRQGGSTPSTSLLLTRLTVAFSRRRAYPEMHPLVKTAESQAFETFSEVLQQQSTVSFSLGHDELLIDNAPVEQGGTVARDLAERLRQRGIGALAFDRQLTLEALSLALRWLATEPETSEDGVLLATKAPTFDGVIIAPIAYGRLALGNAESNAHTEARDIWRLLASAAFFDDDEDMFDGSGTAIDPREAIARKQGAKGRLSDGTRPSSTAEAGGQTDDSSNPVGEDERGAGDRSVDDNASGDGSSSDSLAHDIYGAAGRRGRPDAAGNTGGTGSAAGSDGNGGASGDPDDDASSNLFAAEADPAQVAAGIERRLPREGYAKRVAFVLLRVADQVSHAPPEQRALLGERLRSVVSALQATSIGRIIRSIGVGSDQRKFMSQMIDAMPASAIIEWLETASRATEQDLSHHMLRLLSKLSARAEDGGARRSTETEFRVAAKDLVDGWTLDDPNPHQHGSLLDQLCRYESLGTREALQDPGTARIIQISLEINEPSEDSYDAATQLLAEGRVGELLQWAEEAPGRRAADALQALVVSPDAIRSVLLKDPLDQGVARTLLSSLDVNAAEPLLDVLRDASSRTTRRLVYDRLRELGSALAPMFVKRLDGAPWYFVRNLLALLRDTATADSDTAGSSVSLLFGFLNHQHEQVRVEALRLLVADTSARDAALRHVLDDKSERVVNVAIDLLASDSDDTKRASVSSDLARRLVGFIQAAAHSDALITRAVRALADAQASIPIRDMLLGMTSRRTWLMRKLTLVDARPMMLAALEVLATRYRADPQSAAVLELARRDADKRVQDAAARVSPRRTLPNTPS